MPNTNSEDVKDAKEFVEGVVDAKLKDAGVKDAANRLRVKKASERYSTEKSVGSHKTFGRPVADERGNQALLPSEMENAKTGAIFKKLAQKAGLNVELTEHDQALLEECYEDSWCGEVGSKYVTGMEGMRAKALLDDATSGGLEVVPEWFDRNIISFPLLHSELLPMVSQIPVSSGSTVEGASVGNPTVTWGTAEGTEASLFDTSSLVAEVNTDLHPVSCYIEIGRDFMNDAAVDVGRIVGENVGQSLLNELDKVIADGSGTGRPEGIFQKSGLTDIGNPSGGDGAAPSIEDYEALLFGVAKPYRTPSMNASFIMNDTTYRRARAVKVGAGDERRVFGMDHETYTIFGRRALITDALANNEVLFAAMRRYRLYRRQGQALSVETGGKELTRKNLAMLSVRGRFGGQLVDANAAAFSDNFQA